MPWDYEKINREFTENEERARRRAQELKSRRNLGSYGEQLHDQELAESYIYDRLIGKLCLRSRRELITELRVYLALAPTVPTAAFNKQYFADYWQKRVEKMIRDYENGTD